MLVKRSSYYDWKARRSRRVISSETLNLRRERKRLFSESRQSVGSRRISEMLKKQGYSVGRYQVRRLMKHMNLTVKLKRKYKITTDSRHKLPVVENVLNRNFNPDQPNRVWGADMTYIWTAQGWLYLAVVIDLYSRRVVGWCIDKRMNKSLVLRALKMAISMRRPKKGLGHHSDRGSQYASKKYQNLLEAYNIEPSMSRKGNCWDNAPIDQTPAKLACRSR